MTRQLHYHDEFHRDTHYRTQHHPVRFPFFSTEISIKKQEELKTFLMKELGISIRVKRESGVSTFLSSKESNKKAKKYIFENINDLIDKYDICIELDLSDYESDGKGLEESRREYEKELQRRNELWRKGNLQKN